MPSLVTLGNLRKFTYHQTKGRGSVEKDEMTGGPYLQDEPIAQQGCPLTTGHPQVDLVAEVSIAAVGVAQVLGAQAIERLPSRDQLHLGDAGTHVVLHPIQVENGNHAGPICFTRVVGLQAAGACAQQSCRKFGVDINIKDEILPEVLSQT